MSDTTNPLTHVFDQTNGVVEGLEGESDGTGGGEVRSAADRDVDTTGAVPGDRRPQAYDGPRDTATAPRGAVDDEEADEYEDEEAEESDASEHVFAVDSSGGAVDEGTTGGADAAAGSTAAAASAGEGTSPAGSRDERPAHGAGGSVAAVAADRFDDRDAGTADVAESSASTRTPDDAGAAAGTAAPATGLGALADDDSIAHVFDQTNGVIEGAEGEADGTAEGDEDSAGDRRGLHEPNPVGQQDAWHDDHYGAEDGTDRNP